MNQLFGWFYIISFSVHFIISAMIFVPYYFFCILIVFVFLSLRCTLGCLFEIFITMRLFSSCCCDWSSFFLPYVYCSSGIAFSTSSMLITCFILCLSWNVLVSLLVLRAPLTSTLLYLFSFKAGSPVFWVATAFKCCWQEGRCFPVLCFCRWIGFFPLHCFFVCVFMD